MSDGEPQDLFGNLKPVASMRNTSTGGVLEAMIIPSLRMGGYSCQMQTLIGCRPGGRAHKVDAIAEKNGAQILISLKWQQVNGTAEQKVPFEVICLAEAIKCGKYKRAYLVLGGEGWTLREYFVGGGLDAHLIHADKVRIVTLEKFIALSNQGAL